MSVETVHVDLRAALRTRLLALETPRAALTSATLSGRTLTTTDAVDFTVLFRAREFVSLGRERTAMLAQVEPQRLTFGDAVQAGPVSTVSVAPLPTERGVVSWEGEDFTPVKGRPFISETIRPALSRRVAYGAGGLVRHEAIATLTLFYPAGQGTIAVESMAGRLLGHFEPGTPLIYGTSKWSVYQVEARPLLQEPDWISCPVNIELTAWT